MDKVQHLNKMLDIISDSSKLSYLVWRVNWIIYKRQKSYRLTERIG